MFAGIYPMDQSELIALRTAIDKLTLNDSSVEVNVDTTYVISQQQKCTGTVVECNFWMFRLSTSDTGDKEMTGTSPLLSL